MNLPLVSIIIPTYKRASMLSLTLDSILAQDYPKDRFEIIVGDNNSPDDTQAVLEKYTKRDMRIKSFFEPRQGVHYVRNCAAYIAKGEILYYTDDDMIADPAMLKQIITAFEEAKIGAATGKVLPSWETSPPDWVLRLMQNGILSLHDAGDKAFSSEVDFGVYSCHQAIRREVFFEAGGFNPENTAGVWIGDGETGLNIKIKKLGYHFAYVPGAITYHIIPPYRLTQQYLNNRLANQGNCDSYTVYRRDRPTAYSLMRQNLKFITQLPPDNGMLTCLLQVIWRLIVKKNSDGARKALGQFFYYRNRFLYNIKLLTSAKWCLLVLRDDWLKMEAHVKSE